MSDGDLAIYLDIESIESISAELDVLFEGLLGRVVTHELSHVVRGHATPEGRATHGWFREGDAQRDAWHVLTDLLIDPAWAAVARWGRVAQVRLADRQPSACRWFETDWEERSRLAQEQPTEPPRAWIITPPRAVFVLAHQGTVEVPNTVAARRILGAPCVGDSVYLSDSDMVAGPWIVVATRRDSRTSHPKDQAAVESYAKQFQSNPEIEWLNLRQVPRLLAAPESDVLPGGGFGARELGRDEVARLAQQLTSTASEVVSAVAEQRIGQHQKSADEIAGWYRTANRPMPEGISDVYDPFNDR